MKISQNKVFDNHVNVKKIINQKLDKIQLKCNKLRERVFKESKWGLIIFSEASPSLFEHNPTGDYTQNDDHMFLEYSINSLLINDYCMSTDEDLIIKIGFQTLKKRAVNLKNDFPYYKFKGIMSCKYYNKELQVRISVFRQRDGGVEPITKNIDGYTEDGVLVIEA